MTSPVNISGIIVHARPERTAEVARAIESIAGAEVRAVLDRGRIVVVAEESTNRLGDVLVAINGVPGVVAANLVYQHETADPDELVDAELPGPRPDDPCMKEA